MIRRALLAISLLVTLVAPAFAQMVPALPDTERRTTYSGNNSTCACAIGFQIYGDGTDVDNWIQVWVNGVRALSTDPTFGWSLSSPSGPIGTIRRPITNAILTFNQVQSGTVQIVGAQRPRRLSEFAENTGVSARSMNLLQNNVFSELRELWDKTNDVTGRSLLTQPGNTMKPLPLPGSCVNEVLSFGPDGLTPTCVPNGGGGGGGGGAVSSVSNSDGSLTVSPNTGIVVASLNTSHSNAWGAQQSFTGLKVAVRTAVSTNDTITAADYFICPDNNASTATEHLPSSPTNGQSFLIKDCAGAAAAHNITVSPASGNIDGAGTFIMSTNFQSIAVTYTGSQWSIN